MEFSLNNTTVSVLSEKKVISLDPTHITLDNLVIDCPGEYEKSGILMYVRQHDGIMYAYFRVEGYWLGFISSVPQEIPADILDFFGQLDILVAPFAKSEQKFIEQIEPKMLVSFAESSSDLVQILGNELNTDGSYKLKAQDITSDKTSFVRLYA